SYQDTGLSPSTAYTYAVAAFDAAGNTSAKSTSASATTQALPTTIRIEAGGTANYTDTLGHVWMADTYYTDGTGAGLADRGAIAIANTTDPRLYQTEHYCIASYSIPIANGTYTINLDFAETYTGITG